MLRDDKLMVKIASRLARLLLLFYYSMEADLEDWEVNSSVEFCYLIETIKK